MNKQPYAIPPQRWEPMLSPALVRMTRKYRWTRLRRQQRIKEVRITGGHHLRHALDRGDGVLVTPNHSAHYDSAALYVAADRLGTPLHFMTAWQVFAMSPKWEARMMQKMGCFSIDRESADRAAYKQGVQILQREASPLVIFPEGDIYHVTDRVTPFREGAAAIALSASRRVEREVVVIPCGIKFRYLEDPSKKLARVMSKLEERLFLRPTPHRNLPERIYRFAESLLALKEIEYLGGTGSGLLTERIHCLAQSILNKLESRYGLSTPDKCIPERVKELRRRIIHQLDEIKKTKPATPSAPFIALSQDMDDLFLVMQLYSYPGDYVVDSPTIERLAETIDKFEEDVLQKEIPSIHGRRRVEICFGAPISVPKASQRGQAAELADQMQRDVQGLVDELCWSDRLPCAATA